MNYNYTHQTNCSTEYDLSKQYD